MRASIALLCGALICAGAAAATMEEAEKLFAAKQWTEAAAAYQEIAEREPANARAQMRLARSRAASGDATGALAALQAWVATGNGSYQAAMTLPELQSLRTDPRFVAMMEPLKPCNTPEYRQFDFWIGNWNVESASAPGGVSQSRITSINGGCTVREEFSMASGYAGTSLSFYDSTRKTWHQTWSDNQGSAVFLEGGLQGEAMILATTIDGQSITRITWTRLDQGRVRQHVEATTDGGTNWTTTFDGYYSRQGGS